jgi:hypothetical protein
MLRRAGQIVLITSAVLVRCQIQMIGFLQALSEHGAGTLKFGGRPGGKRPMHVRIRIGSREGDITRRAARSKWRTLCR